MNTDKLNAAAEKYSNLTEYNMNDKIGSVHWFNTLMAKVRDIGVFMNKEPQLTIELQTNWGKSLSDISKDMIEWYAQFKAEQPISDEEIEKLAAKKYEFNPNRSMELVFSEGDLIESKRKAFGEGFKSALQYSVPFKQPSVEDVKRWFQLLVGKGEFFMKNDMEHTLQYSASDNELKCVAGCKHFTSGEVRHHKDCPNYPESLSSLYDSKDEQIKELREALRKIAMGVHGEEETTFSKYTTELAKSILQKH